MFLLIKFTLLYAVVLMLVAMGGMFSERSGVINIALEGIMAIGGLAGVFVLVLFPDLPAPALVALSILASAVSGMIYSLLLGFSAITLKADQTIGGTALNMLATAIAIVLVKAFNNGSDAGNGAASAKLNYTNAAFIYKIGPFTVNIFLFIGIILLICSYVFLFKTKWGLRLRACGEHPQAADSVGINVYQWRYTGVIISGALGGIGGFAYIVPSVTTWNFEVGVARCRIPCPRCYDLRSVETVPHCRSSRILCGIPFPGKHCGLHRPLPSGTVQEHLQHDAVYRIHDYSRLHIQEFPGSESRRYSIR